MPNIFGSSGGGSGMASLSVPGSPTRESKTPPFRSPRRTPEPEPKSFKPASGHPGNLSSEQQKALDTLRQSLLDAKVIEKSEDAPPHQEVQLLRFLRARSFDVNAAREMYLRAEKWKSSVNLDQLCTEWSFEERDVVAKHGWRMYFHKTDRLGRPIFIQDLSNLDPDKVFSHTSPDRIVQNFAVTLEEAVRYRYLACTMSQGHLVDDNFMVLNVAGLGLGTFWAMKNQLQSLLSILDDNFPELSGRVQIINAPYLFSTVWSYIKGWLPAQTAEKIDICGTDYLPTISNYVDMHAWPKHLGGRCVCDVAPESTRKACEVSDAGPWEPALCSVRAKNKET